MSLFSITLFMEPVLLASMPLGERKSFIYSFSPTSASGFVVANNAFYCQGGTAISVASNPNAVVTSNVVVARDL